jgi:hypothetical protein
MLAWPQHGNRRDWQYPTERLTLREA